MSDPVPVSVRLAEIEDAAAMAGLASRLAADLGEHSPVTPTFVVGYLRRLGCHVLLALRGRAIIGLLSYTLRPSLYHAADVCLVDELVVQPAERNCGLGTRLLEQVLRRAREQRCAEVSLSVMTSNRAALRFYQRHGFEDQALLLELRLPTSQG